MIILNYAGNYGLGDYLGPIMNGFRFYKFFNIPVQIKFGWLLTDKLKINESDPETIFEQITKTYNEVKKLYPEYNVEVVHKIGVKPNGKDDGSINGGRHISYHLNRLPQWHEELLFTEKLTKQHNVISIWTPLENIKPIQKWKQTLSNEDWHRFIQLLGDNYQGYKIKYISYRDPIEKIAKTIKNSDLCIGYDGMGVHFSRLFNKPCVLFLEQKRSSIKLTQRKIPWFIRVSDINDFKKKTINEYLLLSKRKIKKVKHLYNNKHKNYKLSLLSYTDVKKRYLNDTFNKT